MHSNAQQVKVSAICTPLRMEEIELLDLPEVPDGLGAIFTLMLDHPCESYSSVLNRLHTGLLSAWSLPKKVRVSSECAL